MPPDAQLQRVSFAGVLLFSTSIFTSALLIFLVQPMVGKHILPWFGGTPGVWMLCLAFYQSTLFLGYAYAHLLARGLRPSRQLIVHAVLLLLALWMLPVLPEETWKPERAEDPSALILAMLLANVALPFFLLASTGPLVQSWFARAFPGRSPYPLYAVSNLGSLLALLSYPFIIEPRLPLSIAARGWSWGFAGCALAVLACAGWAAGSSASPGSGSPKRSAGPSPGPGIAGITLWILLPASAVVVFMGVTNKLCLDVASVPFLWIIPLCIYLTSFILCFSFEGLYRRGVFIGLSALFWIALFGLTEWKIAPASWHLVVVSVDFQVVAYSLALFCTCMIAHGELYRRRPAVESLTSFYLCVSGGGALGGLFVGLLAPRIFSGYHELPLGVVLCWLLVLAACWSDPTSALNGGPRRFARLAAAVFTVAAVGTHVVRTHAPEIGLLYEQRSFFGILRVLELDSTDSRSVRLRNGTTLHGLQLVEDPRQPTSYYGPLTGIGLAMASTEPGEGRDVGVVGLGVGTLAAYGQRGDHMVFYELDPAVARIARDEGHFSYLEDSAADIELVLGDARLSLETELHEGRARSFDLLVVDAFNSDAIPVHLLTLEAFRLYQRHLRPGGALAVHLSNRHFNLVPLVFRLAASLDMPALAIHNRNLPRFRSERSTWVVLSHDQASLDSLASLVEGRREALGIGPRELMVGRTKPEIIERAPLWTDDYSDLFRLLVAFEQRVDKVRGSL